MFSLKIADLMRGVLVAMIVKSRDPGAVVLFTEIVSVAVTTPLGGGVTTLGFIVAFIPRTNVGIESTTAELKPSVDCTSICKVLVESNVIVRLDGTIETTKFPTTFNTRVFVPVM